MSKKYKDKPCAYCVKAKSSTADHVIARKFFLPARRDKLPIVPACQQCNREKAQLEDYLMVVLGFGGRHADAAMNLDTLVRKRLEKNAKLRAELKEGFDLSGGTSIPFDHTRLNKLFSMIARGLLCYHWQVRLDDGYSANAAIFRDSGKPFFDQMLNGWATPNRVTIDLGQGTFVYHGAQATDSPQTSIWSFSMYGGITFGGDPTAPGPASLAVAVTGSIELLNKLRSSLFS